MDVHALRFHGGLQWFAEESPYDYCTYGLRPMVYRIERID
jgi:hypothetical protein